MTTDLVPHGTVGGYCNHACRCEPCRLANRASSARIRGERYAERVSVNGVLVHPSATHGTTNGFRYYGCRCSACCEASKAADRKRRWTS